MKKRVLFPLIFSVCAVIATVYLVAGGPRGGAAWNALSMAERQKLEKIGINKLVTEQVGVDLDALKAVLKGIAEAEEIEPEVPEGDMEEIVPTIPVDDMEEALPSIPESL